tara:strand:+ start:1391 stop:1642 length:252 start_codon:yes stop_codon:yes gene_type:complete
MSEELKNSMYKVFKNMKPRFYKSAYAHSFFECPINGDEEGLIAVLPDKSLKVTDLYDLPTNEEIKEMINSDYFSLMPEWYGNW